MTATGVMILVIGCFVHLGYANQQDIVRVNKRDQEEASRYLHQRSFSQRPTQFLPSLQSSGTSRSALILPANNQVQASSYNQHSPSHPLSTRLQFYNNVQIASPTTSTTTTTTTTTTPQPSSQRFSNVSTSINQPVNMRGGYAQAGTIELALRQTSIDENVFAPSPTNDFNWLSQSINPPQHLPSEPQMLTERSESMQVQHQNSVASTTEQSNNIAQIDSMSSPRVQFDTQQHYRSQKVVGEHQSEYLSNSAGNLTGELNNHVGYENSGSTTLSTGDYYFSSAEKHPNNEKSSNAWWALGFGYEFERASNLTRDDYLDYCTKSELLVSNKQRNLCKTHHKIMPIVARGLKMAIEECQLRFTSSRWNCSLVLQDSLAPNNNNNNNNNNLVSPVLKSAQVFGDVMKHPNRERSFLNAIFAAGLAHAMTKACSQGELPEECSCDKRIKSKSKGKIEWVACSDDIDYGAKFSRDFTDNTADVNDSDVTSMINGHNYEVGRRVFKSATDITCTCLNGDGNSLCQTKRCWKHLGPFSDIGDELMRRYESATHMQLSSKDPHKLRPVRRGVRKPKRKDLVYIDESPDYCSADSRLGIMGTQNRRCNSTSAGPESCSLLCCGRGYQVVVEEIEEDCNCKFVWCCQVKCERCKRHVTNDICN